MAAREEIDEEVKFLNEPRNLGVAPRLIGHYEHRVARDHGITKEDLRNRGSFEVLTMFTNRTQPVSEIKDPDVAARLLAWVEERARINDGRDCGPLEESETTKAPAIARMPASRQAWTDDERRVAIGLFLQLPYGRIHARNPVIVKAADRMGRTPASVAMKVLNMASLSPEVQARGHTGLRNASVADTRLWNEVMSGNEAVAAWLDQQAEAVGLDVDGDSPAEHEEPPMDGPTEVLRTVRQRRGQRFFRRTVLANYDGACCISGLQDPRLLVASHIVPWRVDESVRLTPRNGLCLSVLHDRLFDLGLITVGESRRIDVATAFLRDQTDSYAVEHIHSLHGRLVQKARKVAPDPACLSYHRQHVFLG